MVLRLLPGYFQLEMRSAAAVSIFLAVASVGRCGEDEAAHTVAAMRSTFAARSSIGWIARSRYAITRDSGVPEKSSSSWHKVSRSDDKLASITKVTGEDVSGRERFEYALHKELVFDGSQSIHVNTDGSVAPQKKVADPALIPSPRGRASMKLIGALDGREAFAREPRLDALGSGALVLGYIENTMLLADALAGGRIAPELARDELPNCVAVTNLAKIGSFTAWLDPARGFLPRRIEVRQVGNQLPEVRSGAVQRDGPPRAVPHPQRTEGDRVIDDVTFSEVGGAPIIKSFHELRMGAYENGDRRTTSAAYVIEQFTDPKPDDFMPSVSIQNGTPVGVSYDRNIRYIWLDGKIVQDTTPATTRTLEGVSYAAQPRGKAPHLLIVLNVVAIGAIVLWLIRGRLAKR